MKNFSFFTPKPEKQVKFLLFLIVDAQLAAAVSK